MINLKKGKSNSLKNVYKKCLQEILKHDVKKEGGENLKRHSVWLIIFVMLFLVACNQDNTAPDNPKINETSHKSNNNQNDMVEKIESLPFYKFELDVEYQKDVDFNVELEQNPSGNIDVEYEHSSKGIRSYGKEAFDLLYPKLKSLTITETTSQEEAISEALKVFELEDNYLEFEMDVIFHDGSNMNIDVKK